MSQGNLEIEIDEKKVTRTREVKLSQAEAAEFGIEVGRLAGEIESHKKTAKEAESKQDEIIATLKKNAVTKDVECLMKLFYANRTVQVFDGDEMIEERVMTDGEFQMTFPVQHGVVLDAEEDDELKDVTPEEFNEDMHATMKEERKAGKPSLVDMR